jgi:hypothetical protein
VRWKASPTNDDPQPIFVTRCVKILPMKNCQAVIYWHFFSFSIRRRVAGWAMPDISRQRSGIILEGHGWLGPWRRDRQGPCTHTDKTGAGSESGAGCDINKWVFSHAAGPAELPVWQISVPRLNSTSRAPGRRPASQFQCNCIGTCTRVWTCRCRTNVLNTSVCMKPTRY